MQGCNRYENKRTVHHRRCKMRIKATDFGRRVVNCYLRRKASMDNWECALCLGIHSVAMGSFLRDPWPPKPGEGGDFEGDEEVEDGLRLDFGLLLGASCLSDDFAVPGVVDLIGCRTGLHGGRSRGCITFVGIGGSVAGPYTKR